MFDLTKLSPVNPGSISDVDEFYHYSQGPLQLACSSTPDFSSPTAYDGSHLNDQAPMPRQFTGAHDSSIYDSDVSNVILIDTHNPRS